MSLREQQNLLAKLYTDAEFRREFFLEPKKSGQENGLNSAEIAEIVAIMPEELEFFAGSLFWKRLREAEKFLPLTKKILDQEFSALFREFSQNFNPRSIKKHFEDAFEFCDFLKLQNVSGLAKNCAKFERAKLAFFNFEKRFAICLIDYDLRQINESEPLKEIPETKKIAIWVRTGKRIRHFFI